MAQKTGMELPEHFSKYEDGKHRRYNLLFAVNGGAFAVAKLLTDPKYAEALGGLPFQGLSVGMIFFTILMVVDIYTFGLNLRSTLPQDAFNKDGKTLVLFGFVGQYVLVAIGYLIVAGWILTSWGEKEIILYSVVVGLIVLILILGYGALKWIRA